VNDESKYPKNAGIYKLTCINNGKIYVGKSVCIKTRLAQHKRCGKNAGKLLKNAILKYGWNSFKVEILEVFENFDKLKNNKHLLDREAYYIELNNSNNIEHGYNLCAYSTDLTGIPLTDEHKRNIGNSNRGKVLSNHHKERLLHSRLGKPRSDDTKEKIRLSSIGRKFSEESKEKMRRARLANPPSEEHMEKIRQSNLGRKHSKEHIEKRRLANLGKKRSEESKEKMRQAKLKRFTNLNQITN
jgi:group I intron endonuclease